MYFNKSWPCGQLLPNMSLYSHEILYECLLNKMYNFTISNINLEYNCRTILFILIRIYPLSKLMGVSKKLGFTFHVNQQDVCFLMKIYF